MPKKQKARKKNVEKAEAKPKNIEVQPQTQIQAEKTIEMDSIIEMLSPIRKIELQVAENVKELPKDGYAALISVRPDSYNNAVLGIVKYFEKKGMEGVYVTVNKSAFDMVKNLDAGKIKYEKVYFLDAISKIAERDKENEKFKYVEAPYDLTSIDVNANKLLGEIKEKEKFLVLDSVNALLVYNEEGNVKRFCHEMTERMKDKGVQAMFVLVQSEKTKDIFETLSQFCDKVIEVK